ncbi:hypothetical protein B0J11DRAFT_26406 [Dendryphion nanum]|uniref:Uncharacterized protein n=1 Tax=Dendryphion nanum TaxID=256645 RepID=A0A9P9EG13_9PLEO|nr:hypothetical protein B0J11DRAFT_26406 [Dendryphion nanum]
MVTLLTLPYEIRSQILSYVLNDYEAPPKITSPYFSIDQPFLQPKRIYNTYNLFLTSRLIHAETTAALAHIRTDFQVNAHIIDKLRLVIPTWSFVPYRSHSVESLEITVKTLDIGVPWIRQLPSAEDYSGAYGGGGPFAKLLLNALEICTTPVRRTKGRRYAPPNINTLILNIITPEWLQWEYEEKISFEDMVAIFGNDSNVPQMLRDPAVFDNGNWLDLLRGMAAERMADFLREAVKDSWDSWAKVGGIEVRVDGKALVQALVVGTSPPVLISAPF